MEMSNVFSPSGSQSKSLTDFDESPEVIEKFGRVKQKTGETAGILRTMELAQESIAIKYHDRLKLEGLYQHQQQRTSQDIMSNGPGLSQQDYNLHKERLEVGLRQKLTGLMQLQNDFENKIAQNLTDLIYIQSQVLAILSQWKREEQLAGNGPTPPPPSSSPLSSPVDQINQTFNSNKINLSALQSRCEDLGELIWDNRNQLKGLERLRQKLSQNIRLTNQPPQNGVDRLTTLQTDINELLSNLVKSTFIVEKQPPQIVKKNSRFEAVVRLLAARTLNVHMAPPQVKVVIISEEEAKTLVKTGKCGKSGDIINNTATMKYQPDTRDLTVRFSNLQLQRIKRSEKKEGVSVTDEKFCLLFQSQFTIGEKELHADIWTLSLPVVVIVHVSQEPHAWATITWDNAFGEPVRTPFDTPTGVPWSQLAATLSRKFYSCTGRALTSDNLSFLACKILGTNQPNYEEDPHKIVTCARFCKKPLVDRSFSFWDWFYAIIKLTVEHLKGPWMDGSILGFLGRQQAKEMLSACKIGTFLLRFSDSELGAITISWIHSDGNVYSLEPQTAKNLVTRSLADCINDISWLNYLYPDIPKTNAFSKYYTPPQTFGSPSSKFVDPYVPRGLKTFVPGMTNGSSTTRPQVQIGDGGLVQQASGVSQIAQSPLSYDSYECNGVPGQNSPWSNFSTSSMSPPITVASPPSVSGNDELQQQIDTWTPDFLFDEDGDMMDFDGDENYDFSDIMTFL